MIGGLDPHFLAWFDFLGSIIEPGLEIDGNYLVNIRLDFYSLRPTLDNVRQKRDLDLLDSLFQNILDPVGSKS